MAVEFGVILDDRPGSLARLGGVLGAAGVNIEAIHGASRDGKGFVSFICSDPQKTMQALEQAAVAYTTREVLIVRVLDEPGTLGDVALVMSSGGINIDALYITTHGDVVLGVDDLIGAIQVAEGMAVMLD